MHAQVHASVFFCTFLCLQGRLRHESAYFHVLRSTWALQNYFPNLNTVSWNHLQENTPTGQIKRGIVIKLKTWETQHRRFRYRWCGESPLLFDNFTFVLKVCFALRFGNQACQQKKNKTKQNKTKTVVFLLNRKDRLQQLLCSICVFLAALQEVLTSQ